MVRVFYDWCCVSACTIICIECKRIGDRTVPCGQLVEIEREDESTAW